MNATKILWGQVILVGAVVLIFVWTATEWTAWRLAFQPELGRPWFALFGWPLYAYRRSLAHDIFRWPNPLSRRSRSPRQISHPFLPPNRQSTRIRPPQAQTPPSTQTQKTLLQPSTAARTIPKSR
jgi:hypothetical protein